MSEKNELRNSKIEFRIHIQHDASCSLFSVQDINSFHVPCAGLSIF